VIVDEGVEVFEPDGELLVLTVSAQLLNLYEVVATAIDPSVDLVRKEAVRREGETDEEYRTRQLGLMDQSIETAISLALDRAGIDPGPLRYRIASVSGEYPGAQVLEPGDVLVEVDGRAIENSDDPRTALSDNQPGDRIKIVVERDGEILEFEIELGRASEEEDRAVIGISVGPVIADPPVDIDSGNIGGPSAGMMYTIAIIDLLGEGQLTKGHVIAGTGTIRGDGTVGAIGGIRQKVVAAEAAGADVMLVPRANYDQALTAPRQSMELVPVDTIDDALAALAALDPA
jgi:PDZ domain-containing protein